MVLQLLFIHHLQTTSLVIHTLYHLARNPKEQEVLRQEILKVAPPGYTPTADIINNIAYLKGAVTEAMRFVTVPACV